MMPPRRSLRYAAAVKSPLAGNQRHIFAADYAMALYRQRAVFSMIPKNACTSLRLTAAMANGAIESEADWQWIHANNNTFKPSLADLATAVYTFTVLRCPFARLASCYLDKMVGRWPDAWQLFGLTDEATAPADLTFRAFVTAVCKPALRSANIHWRPQIDFLVYGDYDDWFCVEDFAAAAAAIEGKTAVRVADARHLTQHSLGRYRLLPPEEPHGDVPAWRIEALLRSGTCPHPRSLFDAELREMASHAFAPDFKLHRQHFPGKGLFDG
jgi:hypothetical protein